MPSRRELIQMDDDEIQTFLDEERVLNVATIGPTGHPHVVAMWYALVDRELVFWTFGKSQKVAPGSLKRATSTPSCAAWR
jgi:nitroimidazol reductase NimA-like FMN-containing flavoprotein (pyridoxamine 5'-phosphate oxidase superfamily)